MKKKRYLYNRFMCIQDIHSIMEEIRKVRKVGNSIVVSLPQKMGLTVGEYIKIAREDDHLIITRVNDDM